ncbi:acetyltransferase (GNAT) family protein [Saccharopolyspora erythraea NRRL 2338]|nr:acetyltransferase (GNAT) family protein [Saccharopolyspora erythraea NRRL 2338]
MSDEEARGLAEYVVRRARPADLEGARALMLDTFYLVMGHGYVPEWHADVINMTDTYFRTPGQALFVAALGDEVVGTAALRAGGPKSPPNPQWLAERYDRPSTAQLCRTYVRAAHRRRGLARALVDLACGFVADSGTYDTLYLHTDPAIEGAEPFWRSLAKEIHDERGTGTDNAIIHFEIPLPPPGDHARN